MIQHIVETCFILLKSLGLLGSFLSMLIENIGIPLPTEIGYLIGQELINTSRYSYLIVLLVLTAGHVFGATISYSIGVWGDKLVTHRLKSNKKIQEIDKKLKNWYARFGNLTVFATRFIGYIRPWSSYLAGLARVPFLVFILWTALGSLIFNIICLYLSQILLVIWRRYEYLHLTIAISMFFLFFAFIIYLLIRQFNDGKKK